MSGSAEESDDGSRSSEELGQRSGKGGVKTLSKALLTDEDDGE